LSYASLIIIRSVSRLILLGRSESLF